MRTPAIAVAVLTAVLSLGARADEPVRATFSVYSSGFNVVELETTIAIRPADYRVDLVFRTTGTFGALFHGEQTAMVEGGFANASAIAGAVAPRRFYSFGHWRGRPRVTLIDYVRGMPLVRQLVPSVEEEREPVPEADQAHTIDSLSAMAALVRQVSATGKCDGRLVTFDGRRLADISAHTVGMETLPPTERSSFSGPALRCDFEGRQLAGFLKGPPENQMREARHGSAWLARIVPGGPPLPVLLTFDSSWFGGAMMFLRDAGPVGAPPSTAAR